MKKALVQQALITHRGNLAASAAAIGVSRQTVYRYLEQWPELHAIREEARETMIDIAERTLEDKIIAGDTTCLIFFLKTRGQSRGYVERQEVKHSGDTDNPIAIVATSIDYRAASAALSSGSVVDRSASSED